MPKIKLNDLDYGGSPTVEDADHLMVTDTRNQTLSAQNIITNILGDMAQLEHNATASKPYVKGEYLVLGSYFYKTTDDIAQGDTLVAGTNIEQTNVGAEMSERFTYSTSEQIVGTWIDGSPIYRKSYKGYAQTKAVVILETFQVAIRPLSIRGFVYNSEKDLMFPIPTERSDIYTIDCHYRTGPKTFEIYFADAYSSQSEFYVILEYRKDADIPT